MAQTLKKNTSVTRIFLDNNNLSPEEGKCLAEFAAIRERNRAIKSIREAILAFSATTPLPNTHSERAEQKDEIEYNFNRRYQEIITQCNALRQEGCPDTILQSLQAKHCSRIAVGKWEIL